MQPPDSDDSDEDEEMCMTAVGRRPRNRRVCAAVDSFSQGTALVLLWWQKGTAELRAQPPVRV